MYFYDLENKLKIVFKKKQQSFSFILAILLYCAVLRTQYSNKNTKIHGLKQKKSRKRKKIIIIKNENFINKLWSDMIPLIREPPSRERIYLLGIAFLLFGFTSFFCFAFSFSFVVNRASGKHTQNTELLCKKTQPARVENLCAMPANKPVLGYFCCVFFFVCEHSMIM